MNSIPLNQLSAREITGFGLTLLSILGLVLGLIYGGSGAVSSTREGRTPSPETTIENPVTPITTSNTLVVTPPSSSPVETVGPTEELKTSTEREILPDIGNREDIVRNALVQRGGATGTGGKPAISLRFDHHLNDFGTKVLPLLEKYELPWGADGECIQPG